MASLIKASQKYMVNIQFAVTGSYMNTGPMTPYCNAE